MSDHPNLFDPPEDDDEREEPAPDLHGITNEAIGRAEAHANQDWLELAYHLTVHFARLYEYFNAEQVQNAMKERWPDVTTPEPRAMGSVMRRVARAGVASATKDPAVYVESVNPQRHRGPVRQWVSHIWDGDR